MIPVRPSPPPPLPPPMVPPHPPPCGVVWWWVASLPPRGVWCGSGVGFGGSPPSPPVAWCGLGGWGGDTIGGGGGRRTENRDHIWSGVWRSQPNPPPPNGMVSYGVGGGGVC